MMKNLVVKPTVPALILALAMGLALASCADPVRTEPAEDLPEGRGLARIQLSAGESAQSVRTAVPNMAALYFTLEFTANGKGTVNETLDGSSSLTLDVALPYADWNLEVKGYTDDTLANLQVRETISFSVTAEASASVVVYLTPNVSSGETGSLGYSIKFPDTVSRAILRLYPMDNTPGTNQEIDLLDPIPIATAGFYQIAGTPSLNEGVYQAVIDLYDSDANTASTRTEVAHIYAGSPTLLERDFVAADFAECPPLVGTGKTKLVDKLDAALASDSGTYTIVLAGTEGDLDTFNPQILTVTSKNVNIVLRGNGNIVKLHDYQYNPLFTLEAISGGLTLELRDITLKGHTNNFSLVQVNSGGTLVMKAGSLITGNTTADSTRGGGVYVASGGTFTMSGGTISGNTASYGGSGVYVYGGIFNMSGGTISDNIASGQGSSGSGGGVRVANDGTFNMSNGTIAGNKAHGTYGGGGVYVYNGTFNMSGGAVSGNTANFTSSGSHSEVTYGGGVAVRSDGVFIMSGGVVSGNTAFGASASGGGVYVDNGTFTKSGGSTIYGSDAGSTLKNTASVGHAVYVLSTGPKARNTTAGPGVNLNSDTDENWEP
jgi:hypothetical protein